MTSDRIKSKNKPRFKVELDPFCELSHIIEQGMYNRIKPSAIAAEIRKHGVAAMPPEVQEYLCSFLDGRIESRGRKGLSPEEKKLEGYRLKMLYQHMRLALAGHKDAQPIAIELLKEHQDELKDSYSRSETAWRLVSILQNGHDGHHKNLRNMAGAAKTG